MKWMSGASSLTVNRRSKSLRNPSSLIRLSNDRMMFYAATGDDGAGPWLYEMDVERRVPHRISLEWSNTHPSRPVQTAPASRDCLESGCGPGAPTDRIAEESDASHRPSTVRGLSPRIVQATCFTPHQRAATTESRLPTKCDNFSDALAIQRLACRCQRMRYRPHGQKQTYLRIRTNWHQELGSSQRPARPLGRPTVAADVVAERNRRGSVQGFIGWKPGLAGRRPRRESSLVAGWTLRGLPGLEVERRFR